MRTEKITQEFTELTGFVEDMVAMGLRPSAKVLGTASTEANEAVARQLRVPIGMPVMQIYRGDKIRLSSGLRRRQSPLPHEALPRLAPKNK